MTFPPPSSGPSAQDPYGQDPYGAGAPSPGPAPTAGGRAEWGRPGPTQPGSTQPGPVQPGRPAPGTDLGADLGAGLRFALDAGLRNPVAFIVPGVIYGTLAMVLIIGGMVLGFVVAIPQIDAAAMSSDEPPIGVFLSIYGLTLLGAVLAMPLSLFWQSGAVRAGAEVLAGRRPSFGQAMIGTGRILLTALLTGVIVLVGSMLFYIPGLIAAVALNFAMAAAARGAGPVEALKESVSLVRKNLGTAIVTILVGAAISSVAGMLVITVVVMVPFLMLFNLGIYERLSGRELVDPVRA